MAISIAIERPLQDEVRLLITELNESLRPLSPPDYSYHLTVEQMADPTTTVLIALNDEIAVDCGALRRHGDGVGEVKRKYTRRLVQGRGIGGMILGRIESLARDEGLTRPVLETDHLNHAAWRIYERAGFTRRGPVLDYLDIPYAIFYEKKLDA